MRDGMRVIIAGSRHYPASEAYSLVVSVMRGAPTPAVVLSGGASGIDSAGERWAAHHGIPLERHPADWKKDGRAAGPLRNRAMAAAADMLVLIWDGTSPGSRSMLHEAHARQLHILMLIARPDRSPT